MNKSMRSLLTVAVYGSILFAVSTLTTLGQWATQEITLHGGWNAVYLELQPEPRESAKVFATLPVESVWRWNRRFTPVQFIQDPNTLVAPQPDWLVYFPASHPLANAGNLFSIEGGRPYLIKLRDNLGTLTWTVQGQALVRPIEWLSDSLNFVGFGLPANPPGTFQAFFSGSSAHVNGPVYRLSAAGNWQAITMGTPMRKGEAFWIRCTGQSTYPGPLSVTLAQQSGLDYGRTLVEQTLTIRNNSRAARTIQIRPLVSANPPAGVLPLKAGDVPLYYWNFDPANNEAGWKPLSGPLSQINVGPGQEWLLRLEARRAEMAAFKPPQGVTEAVYQSVLEVTDSTGLSQLLIPVTADGLQDFRGVAEARSFRLHSLATGAIHVRAGLWVGAVEIDKVSQPASLSPNEPTPTATPFQFRILVHVDANGTARLLQKVLQMWKPGTYTPDPADSSKQIVDRPGRYVLVTDDRLIPNFTGAALRDGEPVARRFSTAAFGFRKPIPMSGTKSFGENDSVFSCSVVLDSDDPLNPFLHRYHPDHNNLDERFERELADGEETFSIRRELRFQFTDTDPFNLSLAGWGDTQLGGIYREAITGLHKQPLVLLGAFRLQHAARVAMLNDQP